MKNPLTKDNFAKLVIDRIRQAGEKGNAVYETEEFRLRGEGERGAIIFLANAYREYCAASHHTVYVLVPPSNYTRCQT